MKYSMLSICSIGNLVLGLTTILFVAFLGKCPLLPEWDHLEAMIKLLILSGALGLTTDLSKKLIVYTKPLVFSAKLSFVGSYLFLAYIMSQVIRNWGSNSIYYDGCLITLTTLAMLNNVASFLLFGCWYKRQCESMKVSDPSFFQPVQRTCCLCCLWSWENVMSLPQNLILKELSFASLLSLVVFGSYYHYLVSLIYFFTGVLGLVVAIGYPACNKSMLLIGQVLAYFSFLTALAYEVITFCSHPCTVTAGNITWAIVFLLFHLRVIALFHKLISKQEEFKNFNLADSIAYKAAALSTENGKIKDSVVDV